MGRRTVIAVGLVAATMAVVYFPIVSSLARLWASDDNYSHGFFIIPLALYFAWEKRRALSAAPVTPSILGLAIAAFGLLCLVAGRLGAELFLTRVSLVFVLAGAVLFLFGRRHLRLLVFPLAFLLLMIPLPALVFNQIAFPLQLLASRAGEATLSLAGVPVLREGNILVLPSTTLEVAQACSGIRSLVSLLTLGIVLGYFSPLGPRGRVVLALATVPIAILTNTARVAGTGLAAQFIGPEAAEGFFHEFSGWVMFVLAFAILLALQRLLARRAGAPGATPVPAVGLS